MTDKLFLEVSFVLMDPFIMNPFLMNPFVINPFVINPFLNGYIYCIMDFEAQNNKEARTGLYQKNILNLRC